MAVHPSALSPPAPQAGPGEALEALLSEGQTWGDSAEWLPVLPSESVDLWFTSPPYADARAYSRIHPDHYVEWFLPYGKLMLEATKNTGWLVLNIKNRVASSGPLQGQRHPYVYQLVLLCSSKAGDGWRPTSGLSPTPSRDGSGRGPRTASNTSTRSPRGRSPTLTSTRSGCRIRRLRRKSSGASSTRSAAATPKQASGGTGRQHTCTAAPILAMWSPCPNI